MQVDVAWSLAGLGNSPQYTETMNIGSCDVISPLLTFAHGVM